MEQKIEFGLFDITNVNWLWKGSEEELLETLKTENKDTDKLVNTTFKGHRLFKSEDQTTNTPYKSFIFISPARLLYSEYISLNHARKPFDFYKFEGQALISQDMFTLLAKVGILNATRFKKPPYVPQARNGPVANTGMHYKFGNYYRSPNQAGMRNEISRYSEDREFIPHLTKRPNELSYWDENPRYMSRSWKNNKMKYQWQKHIK